jgi:hypothetical protein
MSGIVSWLELPGSKCLLGQPGSGKSYLAKAAVGRHPGGVFVVDPQEEKDWPCTYLRRTDKDWDIYRALRRGAHLAWVPDKEPGKALRLLSHFCQGFIEGHWNDVWLVVDECDMYAPKNVPSPLCWVAQRGRVHGVRGIWVSQRPASLSHTLLAEATHHALFYLSSWEDPYLQRYGLDGQALRARLGDLEDHRYLLWDGQTLQGPYHEA